MYIKTRHVEAIPDGGNVRSIQSENTSRGYNFSQTNYVYSLTYESPDTTIPPVEMYEIYGMSKIGSFEDLKILTQGLAAILGRFKPLVLDDYFLNRDVEEKTRFSAPDFSNIMKPVFDDSTMTAEEKLLSVLYTKEKSYFGYHKSVSNDAKTDSKAVKKIFKNYVSRSFESVNDVQIAFNPFFSQYGDDEWDFVKLVKDNNQWHRGMDNSDFRETLKKLWSLFNMSDVELAKSDETLLKDIPTAPVSSISVKSSRKSNINNLPLNIKKYRDYLLDQPVSKVVKIASDKNFAVKNMSVGLMIEEIEKKFSPVLKAKKDGLDAANDAYNTVFRWARKNLQSKDSTAIWLNDTHKIIFERKDKVNLLTVMNSLLESGVAKPASVKQLYAFMDTFMLNKGVMSWLRKPEDAENLIELLENVAGDRTAEIIYEIALSPEKGWTSTQWKKFIENYDEYKDTPVAWIPSIL